MIRKILVAIYFASIFLPMLSYADAAPQTLEQRVGNILIKVSYDQEKAGISEPVPFTFDLVKPDESEQVPFDSVWVNIKSKEDNRDLFIADVKRAASGLTSVTYDFPKTGEYIFSISYNESERVLAEHSFDFAMSKDTAEIGFDSPAEEQQTNTAGANSDFLKYAWVGSLLLGIALGWFIRSKRVNRLPN